MLTLVVGLLWSCQTEQAITNDVAATTKKQPLPDGIPSDADDQYEFAKSKFYHNEELITDTITIKNMLANAKGLHIDETGYNKKIFLTNQELETFENTTENPANKSTAALDGDNYLHYFYEVHYQRNPALGIDYFYYFNIVGPRTYSTTGAKVDAYHSGTLEPFFVASYTSGYGIDYYLVWDGETNFTKSSTINVVNTTRYSRRVTFTSLDARTILRDISSKGRIEIQVNSTIYATSCAGISGFKIKSHSSQKL